MSGEDVSVGRWLTECRPWEGDAPVRVEALAQGALARLQRDYNRWAWGKCGEDRAVFDARDGRTKAAFRAAWNAAALVLELAADSPEADRAGLLAGEDVAIGANPGTG